MIRSLRTSKADKSRREYSETELFEGIKAGNEEMIKQLYQLNFYRIKAYIMKKGGREDEAKDIFQDGMLALLMNIRNDRFRPGQETGISAYLFRICANRWHEWMKSASFRKQSPQIILPERTDGTDFLSDLIRVEEATYLHKLFQLLGGRCKELLNRFYFGRQSLAAIAEQMDLVPASAKNEKYRCMVKLKKLHQQQNGTTHL